MQRHATSLIRVLREQLGDIRRGAEIGVWRAELSRELLAAFPSLSLIMVDRWLPLDNRECEQDPRLGRHDQQAHWQAMAETLATTDPARRIIKVGDSVQVARTTLNGCCQFVFIDAHHAYESVLADCKAWIFAVESGGILSGHDYDGRGDRMGRFGVKRAVDEFAEKHGLEVNVEPGNVWWLRT